MTLYPLTLQYCHRRSQDFLCGGALFHPKNWWPFSSHHPLLHGLIAHTLPIPTILCFCLIPTKMLGKIFFVALGVHLHPLHLPGYAYECWSHGEDREQPMQISGLKIMYKYFVYWDFRQHISTVLQRFTISLQMHKTRYNIPRGHGQWGHLPPPWHACEHTCKLSFHAFRV